jgi:hypothetical protein
METRLTSNPIQRVRRTGFACGQLVLALARSRFGAGYDSGRIAMELVSRVNTILYRIEARSVTRVPPPRITVSVRLVDRSTPDRHTLIPAPVPLR